MHPALEVAILAVVVLDLSVNVWALLHVRKPRPKYGPVK